MQLVVSLYKENPPYLILTATRSSIQANWQPALIDGSTSVSLTYSLMCSSTYELVKDVGTSTTATLTNLTPFTNYICCVRANASAQFLSRTCTFVQTMEDSKYC